ncbi:Rop-like family nitrogen fixation protein (plasmid) [Rhizobium sp. NXC14]|nr:Rop-like family nitrogen fixation protein [Rhizobium sp. NXC14]
MGPAFKEGFRSNREELRKKVRKLQARAATMELHALAEDLSINCRRLGRSPRRSSTFLLSWTLRRESLAH